MTPLLSDVTRGSAGVTFLLVALAAPPLASCTSARSCGSVAIDVALSGGGAPTARAALDGVLHDPPARLSKHGWTVARQDGSIVTFTSGSDRVEVTRAADGTWMETGYTAC
jgi:hypothetical protein